MSALLYACCFLFPALCSLSEKFRYITISKLLYWQFIVFLILIIGLRFEVGPDWFLYTSNMSGYADFSWASILHINDPAFAFINFVANSLGFEIWFTNLVCAIIFCTGLALFCQRMPNKWLALAVAIPYIVMVFSINYTRQSAAFGLSLIALIFLFDRRNLSFFICMIAATLFHITAFIFLFFGILGTSRKIGILGTSRKIGLVLMLIVIAYLLFSWLVVPRLESLIDNYIYSGMSSGGAGIRLALNCLPAAFFLLFSSRFHIAPNLRRIWKWWAIFVLGLIPVMWLLYPSTTIVDRFNLYLAPIQILVFAHLPQLVKGKNQRLLITILVLTLYAALMYVWFSYANFAWAWFPYGFYPLEHF